MRQLNAKVADFLDKLPENRLLYLVGLIGLVFVIAVCFIFWLIFFSFESSANASHRVEGLPTLANFSGSRVHCLPLAFVGVCSSIPFLVAQVKAARSQVTASTAQIGISNRQAAIADQTNKDSSRQALFIALSDRVDEVINTSDFPKIDPQRVNQRL